jgi:DNA-binding transcriptional LysR family regulator
MRFTLRQLEYVVAAGELESVTLAARRAHASQPTVSAAIAQVERGVGVQLFIRHHAQGLSVTPGGRAFLDEAAQLLRHASELERLAGDLTGEVAGRLDIGCLVTLAPMVAPELCRTFREQHPGVEVELHEAGQAELLAQLRRGRLSVALTYDLELGAGIAFQRLATLPPHALLAAGHGLATRASVALRELADEPLILLDLPLSREYFRSLFAAAGLEPRVAMRSASPEVIRSLVANGYGYSLVNALPRSDVALDGRRLATVRLAGRPRPMHLGVASLADLREPRAVAAFRQYCRSSIRRGTIPGMAALRDTAGGRG